MQILNYIIPFLIGASAYLLPKYYLKLKGKKMVIIWGYIIIIYSIGLIRGLLNKILS